MFDATQIQGLKDVGSAVAIIGFQAYNVWKHRQNSARIIATQAQVSSNYDDIKGDLVDARAALERIAVKVYGERRGARPLMSTADAEAARQSAQRWKDFPRGQGFGDVPPAAPT